MLGRSVLDLSFALVLCLPGLVACPGEAQDPGTSGPGTPPPGPSGLLPGEFGGVPTTGIPTTDPSTSDEPGTTSTTTSTTTTGDEATTIAPDPEACGNNVLDPGETCDLGL